MSSETISTPGGEAAAAVTPSFAVGDRVLVARRSIPGIPLKPGGVGHVTSVRVIQVSANGQKDGDSKTGFDNGGRKQVSVSVQL